MTLSLLPPPYPNTNPSFPPFVLTRKAERLSPSRAREEGSNILLPLPSSPPPFPDSPPDSCAGNGEAVEESYAPLHSKSSPAGSLDDTAKRRFGPRASGAENNQSSSIAIGVAAIGHADIRKSVHADEEMALRMDLVGGERVDRPRHGKSGRLWRSMSPLRRSPTTKGDFPTNGFLGKLKNRFSRSKRVFMRQCLGFVQVTHSAHFHKAFC